MAKSMLAPKMNDEKKIFLAKALFIFALSVAIVSAFQNWELVSTDIGLKDNSRDFASVLKAVSLGFIDEYDALFPHKISTSGHLPVIFRSIFYAVSILLALFLLGPIFFSIKQIHSRIICGLWSFCHLSSYGLMIYVYQKHSPYVFVMSLGGGRLGYQTHISWLSGFYFGCAALFLHLCAMLILFFPLRKKPTA
jgi:hypothetical protein